MSEKITDPREAFVAKIQALYYIENQITRALPKMEKAATDPGLKEGFKMHLSETEGQVKRLEDIFDMLDEEPDEMESDGIDGIIADGTWVMEVEAPEELKDAMLAAAARYVEHYEMAGYLSAILEADALGLTEATDLLEETLEEEEATDEKLEKAMQKSLGTAGAEE